MEDNYYINFRSVSLSQYALELKQAELLPSRQLLKDDIDARFRPPYRNRNR